MSMTNGFPTRQVFASSRWFKSSNARRTTTTIAAIPQADTLNDDPGRLSSSQGLHDLGPFHRSVMPRQLASSQYGYNRDCSQPSQCQSTQSSQAPYQDLEHKNLVEFDVMKQLVTSIDNRLTQLQGNVQKDIHDGAQTWKKIEELVTKLQEVTSRIEIFQNQTSTSMEALRCDMAEVKELHREFKRQKTALLAPKPEESQLFDTDAVWSVDDNASECRKVQPSNPRKRRYCRSQVKLEESEPDSALTTSSFFELAIPEPRNVVVSSEKDRDESKAGVLTEDRKTRRQRKLEDSEITVPLEFLPFKDFLQPKKSKHSQDKSKSNTS